MYSSAAMERDDMKCQMSGLGMAWTGIGTRGEIPEVCEPCIRRSALHLLGERGHEPVEFKYITNELVDAILPLRLWILGRAVVGAELRQTGPQ